MFLKPRFRTRDLEILSVIVSFSSPLDSHSTFPYCECWSLTENVAEILTLTKVISEDELIISQKDCTVNGYSLFLEFSFWYPLGDYVRMTKTSGKPKPMLTLDYSLL